MPFLTPCGRTVALTPLPGTPGLHLHTGWVSAAPAARTWACFVHHSVTASRTVLQKCSTSDCEVTMQTHKTRHTGSQGRTRLHIARVCHGEGFGSLLADFPAVSFFGCEFGLGDLLRSAPRVNASL